ncbi:MAG TPA: hypothetical protein VKB19_20625 [Pedobacter sp.]|nr:hypothetical protein [Pedobacter sp.]
MEQMNIADSMKVDIDFSNQDLPASVRKLEPLVWKDGDTFCCVLGPDSQDGIFGCGESPEAALADWDAHLAQRLATSGLDDEVAQYARDVLKAGDTEVW